MENTLSKSTFKTQNAFSSKVFDVWPFLVLLSLTLFGQFSDFILSGIFGSYEMRALVKNGLILNTFNTFIACVLDLKRKWLGARPQISLLIFSEFEQIS